VRLDRDGVQALEPGLGAAVRHAVFWPGVASVSNPLAVTRAYAARFGELGGILLTGDARSLHRSQGRWRVETEDGTHGWGEAYVTHGREEVIALLIDKMAPHVIGRPVFNIRHTGQIMFDDFAIKRGSMELLSAWSAIEIASWDIIGKIAGQPVYNLLGGPSRERVRIYANGWAGRTTIEDGVERAEAGRIAGEETRYAERLVVARDEQGELRRSRPDIDLRDLAAKNIDVDVRRSQHHVADF
jgi:hypothetical protein